MQYNLFTMQEIQEETEKAVQQGLENANQEWKEKALQILEKVARSKEEFTVEDVRKLVLQTGLITHDRRAMGGVMRRGVANGWITKTGFYTPSKVGHGSPIQLWKSNIYAFRKN